MKQPTLPESPPVPRRVIEKETRPLSDDERAGLLRRAALAQSDRAAWIAEGIGGALLATAFICACCFTTEISHVAQMGAWGIFVMWWGWLNSFAEARALRRDAAKGFVLVRRYQDSYEDVPDERVEFLPVSGRIWAQDGRPSLWRSRT